MDASLLPISAAGEHLLFLFDPKDDESSNLEETLRKKFPRLVTFEDSEVPPPGNPGIPDLIIIVVGRLEFNDISIVRWARENPLTSTTPILLLAEPDAQERCIAALKEGADDVAFKPLQEFLLLARIDAHIALAGIRRNELEVIGRAQEQLRRSERRHRLIASGMGEVMWATAGNGGAAEAMPMWESITGQSPVEYSNFGWVSAIHPADRRSIEEAWKTALQTGKRMVVEFRLKRRDGEYCYMRAKGVPLRNSDGQIVEWAGTIHDISERRQAEEKLRILNEDLERRIEVRTEELVESQTRLRSLIIELNRVEQVERQKIAAELHDNQAQLLVAARLAIGEGINQLDVNEVPPSLFNVRKLIAEALESTRNLMTNLSPPGALEHDDLMVTLEWIVEKLGKSGLRVELSSNEQRIPLDRDRLLIVFQSVRELLLNALKYSGVSTALVKVHCSRGNVEMQVVDEGAGFATEKLEKPTGGGFGLLNLRERILGMGGTFQIESTPGKGTLARIAFSVEEKDEGDDTDPALPISRPNDREKPKTAVANGKTAVLLVDDHRMIRQGLRRIIEEKGDLFVIGESADGLDALDQARQLHPDVVLMDVNMPRMNGLEATRRLHTEMPELTIIGLSLHTYDSIADGMMEAGAVAYISKEEASDTLCATIRREIGKKGTKFAR